MKDGWMEEAVSSLEDALQEQLSKLISKGAAPGITITAIEKGELLEVSAGESVAGTDTRLTSEMKFPIACFGKPLMSALCLQLHVEGKIHIDAPVTEYLPSLANGKHDPAVPTIRHLLSYTGGYIEPKWNDARWSMTWDRFAEFFPTREQVFAPGAVASMSQTGHALVAQIIRVVLDREPHDALVADVFDPLGFEIAPVDMLHSQADIVPPHRKLGAAKRFHPMRLPGDGGFLRNSISPLALRPRDALRLIWELVAPTGATRISEAASNLLTNTAINAVSTGGGPFREHTPDSYGLGIGSYGQLYGQTGSMVGTSIGCRIDVKKRVGVIVALNSWQPGTRDYVNALTLASIMQSDLEFEPAAISVGTEWSDLSGVYESLMLGLGEVSLEVVGDHCRVTEDGGSTFLADLWRMSEDKVAVNCASPWLSLGLGVEPSSGEVYLKFGSAVLKKRS